MQTLLPFYAFDHAELEKRNAEAEKTVETFTMIVKKGKVEIQVGPPWRHGSLVLIQTQWNDDYSRDHWWASRPRADAQVNLMEPFMSMLSDFRYVPNSSARARLVVSHARFVRATFTIHDQPSIMPSHDRMKELTDLAKKHQGASPVRVSTLQGR